MSEDNVSEYYDEGYYNNIGILKNINAYIILNTKAVPFFFKFAGYTMKYKPANALDIGCAIGIRCRLIKDYMKIPCKGIDISEFIIKLGREKYKFQDIIVGDVSKMTFLNKEFEFTICTRVLEELTEDKLSDAVKEIIRVTKDYIVVSVATVEDSRYDFNNLKPVEWWIEEFQSNGVKLINQQSFDTDTFLCFEVPEHESGGNAVCPE